MGTFNMEDDPTGMLAAQHLREQAALEAQRGMAVPNAAPGEMLIGENGTFDLPPPPAPSTATPQSVRMSDDHANYMLHALDVGGPEAAAIAAHQLQVPGAGVPGGGIGYDPGTPAADPSAGAAEGPAVGTTVPNMSQERAHQIVEDTANAPTGPVMTPANLAAKRAAEGLNADNSAAYRRMGDNYAMLGEHQDAAQQDIARRISDQGVELERQAIAQKEDDDRAAATQEEFRGKVEEGRKEYNDAVKNFNPERLLGSPGRRVGFTIAAALGALGSSWARSGSNQALAIIEDALDRDTDQQRTGIAGKRENISLLRQQSEDYRQIVGDARAARLAAKANAAEGLANYVDGKLASVHGEEAKVAGANLKEQLYMKANEWRLQAYTLAARPSGKAPMTEAEKILLQQKLMGNQLANRQTDVATQAAEAKANGTSKEGDTPEAAKNRRGKLASTLAEHDTAVSKVDKMIALVQSGAVGSYSASAPNMIRSKAGDDFDTLRKSVMDATARNYGGPVTETDRETAKDRWGALKWTDKGLLDHLVRMRDLTTMDRDRILRGQNPEDVAAIQKALPKAKPSEAQIKERMKTR